MECLKMLYEDYCTRSQSVVYGSAEEEGEGTSSVSGYAGATFPEAKQVL